MVVHLWILFLHFYCCCNNMNFSLGGSIKFILIYSTLFYLKRRGVAAGYLGKHGVELLPRAVVASLGQELLDLLPHLILVQMPAVVVVDAGARSRVRRT